MPTGIYPRTKEQLERLKKDTPFQKGHTINLGKKRPYWNFPSPMLGKRHTQKAIEKIKAKRAEQNKIKKEQDRLSAINKLKALELTDNEIEAIIK